MLLSERFPPDIRVENEVASLLGAGHDVHLLCREDARDVTELPESIRDLVVHTVTPRADTIGWRRHVPNFPLLWFYDARWAREIRRLARELGPFDAIHVHDLPLVKTALRAGKRMGARVVADLHENYPMVLPFYLSGSSPSRVGRYLLDTRRWEKYERRCVPSCAATIAVTDGMKGRLGSIGVDPDRITVVENFVDPGRFLAHSLETALLNELRDRYVITYAGNFLSDRGLDTALLAMQAVVREVPEALLLLVGDGGTKAELGDLSRDLGLQEHVRFEGWVEFSRLPSYLAASDVCIIPLIRTVQTDTALSHKLFQYMLMGKPVVVSECVEMSRVILDAGCGLLFPPGDSDALAKALIRLRDQELAHRFGERGRLAVQDRYNWARSASKLLAIYDEWQGATNGEVGASPKASSARGNHG